MGAFALVGQLVLQGNMKKIAQTMRVRAPEVLLARGEEILADSQENYVPYRSGDLYESGYVVVVGTTVKIAYGQGASAAYAAAIHEHPSQFSPPSWDGVDVNFQPFGHGPKYLDIPLMNAVATFPKDVADDLHVEHLL